MCVFMCVYVCVCVVQDIPVEGPCPVSQPPLKSISTATHTHIQTRPLASLRVRAKVTSYRHPAGCHKNQTSLVKVREKKRDREMQTVIWSCVFSLLHNILCNLLYMAHLTQNKFIFQQGTALVKRSFVILTNQYVFFQAKV